jgi:hypothetical protein
MQALKKDQGLAPKKNRGPKVTKLSPKTQRKVAKEPARRAEARVEPEQAPESPQPEECRWAEPEKGPETPEPKVHSWGMKKVTIRIDQGIVIKGKINLRSELAIRNGSYDYYSLDSGAFFTRVSDLFAKGLNPFIEVLEVEGCIDGTTLIINKNKIIWVSPEAE